MTQPTVKLMFLALISFCAAFMGAAHSAEPILPGAETYSVTSSTTGRTYQIFTSTPMAPAPEGGYPIIYLTDANAYFGTMVETMRHYVRGGADRHEAVIVGIGYPLSEKIGPARAFDLTTKLGDMKTPEGFGGASGFLKFILTELKPQIESRFPINKNRQTLFGHSFGGLFTLQTLINEPGAFQTYLIASPSIWWGERHSFQGNFIGRLSPKLETTGSTARVLITVGSEEQPKEASTITPPAGRPVLPGVLDRTQVDDSKKMAAHLQKTPGLHTELIVFEGENHGSVVPAAISRGVTFALDPANKQPAPAVKHSFATLSAPKPVPSAEAYTALTPKERFDLRIEMRAWPKDIRDAWITEFKYNLDAALWYDDHYALHAEKTKMDITHGTSDGGH